LLGLGCAFAQQKQAVGQAGHKKTKLLLIARFLVEQLGALLAFAPLTSTFAHFCEAKVSES
jgi:hypothetical protein